MRYATSVIVSFRQMRMSGAMTSSAPSMMSSIVDSAFDSPSFSRMIWLEIAYFAASSVLLSPCQNYFRLSAPKVLPGYRIVMI